MIVRLEEKPDVFKNLDDEKSEENSKQKLEKSGDIKEIKKDQLEKEIVVEDKEVE